MKITTDMIAVGGLVIALVAGIVLSAPAELLTGIVGIFASVLTWALGR